MEEQKKENKVLIIIPAYNEAATIENLLHQLEAPEIAEIADVLVMNDGSSDGTNWIVKEHGYAVVTHVFNLGYGSGLQLGYKYAVRRGYDYVIQMDADGQHDVCNIRTIYDKLITKDADGHYPDIVLGSRFMKGSGDFETSFVKRLAINLFRGLIYLGTKQHLTDPTTGLQGLDRKAFLFYSKYNHFDDKFPDANMLMQMIMLGYRVTEVPAVMHIRTTGTSMHSGLKPFIYMFRMAFSILAVWIRIRIFKIDVEKKDEKLPT